VWWLTGLAWRHVCVPRPCAPWRYRLRRTEITPRTEALFRQMSHRAYGGRELSALQDDLRVSVIMNTSSLLNCYCRTFSNSSSRAAAAPSAVSAERRNPGSAVSERCRAISKGCSNVSSPRYIPSNTSAPRRRWSLPADTAVSGSSAVVGSSTLPNPS
jgi:hypothetical protein